MQRTAAEKQRECRRRRDADPTRRMEYLQKQRDVYRQDLECGKRKLIADMTERPCQICWKLISSATRVAYREFTILDLIKLVVIGHQCHVFRISLRICYLFFIFYIYFYLFYLVFINSIHF